MAQAEFNAEAAIFTQEELCVVAGLPRATVDAWLFRGNLERPKVAGRTLRGVRLFSALAIFEAKFIGELVTILDIGPSEAAKVLKCDWNAKNADWKLKVVQAVDRSVQLASVYLLIKRRGGGWITQICYGDKDGPFEIGKGHEKWLAEAFAVLPISLMLTTVLKGCKEIRNSPDQSRTRRKT
jgi:hypothetical protein